jgi:hypothetical protein
MKVVVAKFRFVHYYTFYKEHMMLKLETIAQMQKEGKRKTKWNELKAELEFFWM